MDDVYYYTGKPCKRGHISKRYKRNNVCVECFSLYIKNRLLNEEAREAERIRSRKKWHIYYNKLTEEQKKKIKSYGRLKTTKK